MPFAALSMRVQRALNPPSTRPCFNSPLSPLFRQLSGQIGSESAKLELKWMREEIKARRTPANASRASLPSRKRDGMEPELAELEEMVGRRLKGEPLQYILGGYD